jgi:HEAT repeat protein
MDESDSHPAEAILALIEALRDPEVQVRANAAHALARLDTLPSAAIPLLIEATTDANDGLRMNAALALKRAPAGAVGAVMEHLVAGPSSRVRLIAAGSLLEADVGSSKAGAVVVAALGGPALRIRKAALELVEPLGAGGAVILEGLKKRHELEGDAEVREMLARLIERLSGQARPGTQPGGSAEAV